MIRIHRVLTLEEYRANNKIVLLQSTFWRRANFRLFTSVLPVVGFIGLVPSFWFASHVWHESGNNAVTFGVACAICWLCIWFGAYPLFFRRKLAKLYGRQELNRPATIEISDRGIKTTIAERSETQFEWAFFSRYIESDEYFTIIQDKRLIFITIPKHSVAFEEQAELRTVLGAHLPA
jgi:YcxB-like protein